MQLIRNTVGLLALVSVANLFAEPAFAQCADGESVNRREPGSLLLFPEYQNGPGRVTVVTVTNTNCSTSGNVEVEFKYITGENCLEANEEEQLTPCDTITLITNQHTGIGEGYFYVFARSMTESSDANLAGDPIVFNHLVGSLLVINAFESLDYSINAVSFKAFGDEGDPTDTDTPGLFQDGPGDGIRDLDGTEYERAPDRILIPRFLGQNPVLQQRGLHSDLILIALSGGRAFEANQIVPGGGTTVLIHGWNDNEVMFSLEHTFDCWQKIRLGLLRSADVITPVPGTTAFDQATLDDFNSDPNEINGVNREAGWFWINGLTASSSVETIIDPAIYAVLIENIRGHSAADLPFELCSQDNGDLLPSNIRGDYNPNVKPHFNNMDNQ